MIKFQPKNKDAFNVIHNITERLDGRKRFDDEEVSQVISFAFAHSHKPFFNITGHPEIVEELVDKNIFKRHSGKRNYTLADGLIDPEAHWSTVKGDNTFKHLLFTKSRTFYCNREDSLSLTLEDLDTIGFLPASLLILKDKEATLASWKAGYKPSLRFLDCDFEGMDEDEVKRWEQHIALAIRTQQWAVTQIQGGYAVNNPQGAGVAINNEVTRFTRDHNKNFAFLLRDRYGRETTSYGGY